MQTFATKLAISLIPLFVLVGSATACAYLSEWYVHHPLSWHRRRRSVLRALAAGVMFR